MVAQVAPATAHVVITGGTRAGAYDVQSLRAGGCSADRTGDGVFSIDIGNARGGPGKLSSVQLAAPNPSPAGSSQFMVQIGFGPVARSTLAYVVETRPTATRLTGSGRVAIADEGNTATVTFYATTASGVKFTGTVVCTSVTRR